jgi:hypothetical protein
MTDNFPVITVCGSMRFADIMLRAARELTVKGYIVIMPYVADYAGAKEPDAVKAMLDKMHMVKIDMASRILIVTDDTDYIGESTKGELAYAIEHGKRIEWYRMNEHITSGYSSAWGGTAISEFGVVHITDAVSAYPTMGDELAAKAYTTLDAHRIRVRWAKGKTEDV